MRVLVAAASFSPQMSGIQRHAFNLVRCLLRSREVSVVDLVVAPWQQDLAKSAGFKSTARLNIHQGLMGSGSLSRNLWYLRQLPDLVKQLRSHLVHLSYPVPVNRRAIACPIVVTLHDLYPLEIPGNFHLATVAFNRMVLRQCLQSVDAIACVSDATLARLKVHTPPHTWRKMMRIYNSVDTPPIFDEAPQPPPWSANPFLLCVAQHRRNKNLPLLLRVFHRLLKAQHIDPGTKLVIVGIDGPETKYILRLVVQLGLSGRVCFVAGLPESELQWCYRHCEALIMPSSTEGFGLPVAEGLLAGSRVICSDIPALREIGAGHCRFVQLGPAEEGDFMEAIVQEIRKPPPMPVSLPQFSANTLSNQYVRLYENLIAMQSKERSGTAHSDPKGASGGIQGAPLQTGDGWKEAPRGHL